MKSLFISLLLFSAALPVLGQKGFKVIRKAKRNYEHGRSDRALKLLTKAETMNYGWCGNARMSANREVQLLRMQIYMDRKDYAMVRNSIDSMVLMVDYDKLDSIKIRTYQYEYGKDSLSSMIDSALFNATVKCQSYKCFAVLPLENGERLTLRVGSNQEFILYEEDESLRTTKWLYWFKDSKLYTMAKEKD